jgi:hypothetical protein
MPQALRRARDLQRACADARREGRPGGLTIYRSFHRRLLEPIGDVPPAEFEAD